jgi:predicted O-methyltransferase YrrM
LNFFSLFKRNLIYKFKKKKSIDIDNIKFNTLDELFHHYGSDKANIFKLNNKLGHGFSKFYEKNFKKFKDKKINILEIGSYGGGSAAAFVKYFPNINIFCFDINISNFKYKSKNIHVFGIDINNEKKINKILESIFLQYNLDGFDLIIDDGSHNLSDILNGLKFFFQYVKSNGIYIIEDFKHPNYYTYNKNINHIFIDELLNNLQNKKISISNVFTQNDQIDLINQIEKIESYKGNLDDSDIAFINKR